MSTGFDFPSHIAQKVDQQGTKIDFLDKRVTDLERDAAVSNERQLGMQASLSKIDNNTTWLVRLIVGALIAGALAFMIKGGFSG